MLDRVTVVRADHFIPFRKSDVLAMCADGKVASGSVAGFRDVCAILQSIIHFEFHQRLERLKDLYAPFDPCTDTRPLTTITAPEQQHLQKELVSELEGVLAKANFERVSSDDLNRALAEESVFHVQLHTDLGDFADLILYRRGSGVRKERIARWFGLRSREITVEYYERVAVYVRFHDEAHFAAKPGVRPRGIVPGSTVLKLFQSIPKADLEMLFPNVDVRMKLADQAMIGVPAVLGGVGLLAKLSASLAFVFLLVAFWLGLGERPPEVNHAQLVALGLSLFALASHLLRQYGRFKNRKILFMKALADNLYFKNLDNNAGVFHHLIDAAEEEECKEAILAYAFLLDAAEGRSTAALDTEIEAWFRERWRVEVDFEIEDALGKLARLGLASHSGDSWRAVPVPDAKRALDQRWDDFFRFANPA
jgi:hypothetical protein